ncbi:MAG: sulfatase [bacterium]|nr:sulfatase [bacterium]
MVFLLCGWSTGWCALACTPSDPAPQRPDIAVIVLDTVRRDRLSSYGYPRKTSPQLDHLAQSARVFDNAYATSSWTTPSHASLFSGWYPVRHGATQENWQLSPDVETLAEIMTDAGYQTVGVAGNVMITAERGFAQGFEIWHESWRGAKNHLRDSITVDWLTNFLSTRDDPRPLFLFVNLIGAHTPYDSCGSSCGVFGARLDGGLSNSFWKDYYLGRRTFDALQLERLNRLYDAEIREADANLARVLRAFDSQTDAERSFVAVTSDHGENIGDHGHVNHVFSLYETTVQIPLLIRHPTAFAAGTRDGRPVQLVDLFASALAAAGIAQAEHPTHGRSLLGDEVLERPILTEYYRPDQAMERLYPSGEGRGHRRTARYERRLRTLSRGGWKLVWGSNGKHELYHLASDPAEAHDRIDDPAASEIRNALLEELAALVEELGRGEPFGHDEQPPLDAKTREELRALGYLE